MIHVFNSTMAGAPVLSGIAGAMVDVLDACLANGWGVGVVDSVVIDSGVATVTRLAGHSLAVDTVAEISGATTTGGSINGLQKVLASSSTGYTFATALPNQTASGTITHKLAPAGWEKSFGGTTLGVYKSLDVAGTQRYLRVADTDPYNARVVGYDTMSDQNTGTGPFPTPVQVSGGAFWTKSGTPGSTARPWTLLADSRGFYLLAWYYNPNANYSSVLSFGDFKSNKAADGFACMLTGHTADTSSSQPIGMGQQSGDFSYGAGVAGWAVRGVSGVGSAQAINKIAGAASINGATTLFSGASSGFMAYPNAAENGLYLVDFQLLEVGASVCFRGVAAGAYFCPMNLGGSAFVTGSSITGVSGLLGRTLMALNTGTGAMFVDTTGPWAR